MISPRECTKMTDKEAGEFADAEKQIDKKLSEEYLPGGRVVIYLRASDRVLNRLAEAYRKKTEKGKTWKVKLGSGYEGSWLEFTT